MPTYTRVANQQTIQSSHINVLQEGIEGHDVVVSRMFVGAGTPEGVVIASVGSLYLRTDGGATTTLYIKTSGTTAAGWTAK